LGWVEGYGGGGGLLLVEWFSLVSAHGGCLMGHSPKPHHQHTLSTHQTHI
jgi:hypothetical protein